MNRYVISYLLSHEIHIYIIMSIKLEKKTNIWKTYVEILIWNHMIWWHEKHMFNICLSYDFLKTCVYHMLNICFSCSKNICFSWVVLNIRLTYVFEHMKNTWKTYENIATYDFHMFYKTYEKHMIFICFSYVLFNIW